nr:hypothetical protein [uncultured Flavobacterium sp.]
MKILLFFIVLLLSASCEFRDPIIVTQNNSNEMITFEDNYMDRSLIKDSIRMSIPLEFEIKINSSIEYIAWVYRVNNKTLDKDYFDYEVYNKKNKTKQIRQLNFDESFNDNVVNVIVKERNHLIAKKDAKKLLKKYNIHKSLDGLKSGDTIKLTTYNKFREENKAIINDFAKINDSINFRVMKNDGNFFYVSKKINW